MDSIIKKINKAALEFLTPQKPDEMYEVVVNEAKKLFQADYGSILLEQENGLNRVYSSDQFFNKIRVRENGFTHRTHQYNKLKIIDVSTTPNYHEPIVNQGVQTVVLIPLSYKKKSIGVLSIHFLKKSNFPDNHQHELQLFGSMASLAIRKAQLIAETENALETRDMFISLASHELRTPLTSLNGYIQLLHNRLAKQDTVEAKWIRELYDESIRLTNLVKELMEVNRIKQGQLQFNLSECSMKSIIEKAIERIKFTHPGRKVLFKNDLGKKRDIVIGDCDKLLQVISSLLINATKFSEPHTQIEVELSSDRKNIITKVIDHGSGIVREDIGKIFEGFYKGKQHQKEGMGVGLLLAKHIISYHHGAISISSEVEKGTVVEVLLPKTAL